MNPLALAVVSALVAHNMQAVEDILNVLARQDPKQAGELMEAIDRGNKARTTLPAGKHS